MQGPWSASLAAHPGANLHNAFYDLGIDARRVVEQLAKDMHHLATVLSPEQAEELWDLLPANWAECQQQLLPRLPTPRREHELARLLHQAREASGPEHGRLLAALVPALPVEQRAPAIHEALAATNQSGPDRRPVVLSLVAQHLLPEHLPLAVELASRTWPSSYNALQIFLRRLPGGIRAQAMRLLQFAAPSLPAANRDEIMRALGLFRVDEEAAVALIDWENTRQAPALSRLLARESRWDNRQFLDALTHLRDRALPGGVPQANQEAEYRLLVRRLSRAPGLRVQLVDWFLQTLEQHQQSRAKLLAAIDLVAPTIRAVAGEVGADAWVEELHGVGEDWP